MSDFLTTCISWREQDTFNDNDVHFVLDQHELDLIVLAGSNNSPRLDMLLHSDTLPWSRAIKSICSL